MVKKTEHSYCNFFLRLVAAKILSKQKQKICGIVKVGNSSLSFGTSQLLYVRSKFLFQPGEESFGGAFKCIKDGVTQSFFLYLAAVLDEMFSWKKLDTIWKKSKHSKKQSQKNGKKLKTVTNWTKIEQKSQKKSHIYQMLHLFPKIF